MHMQQKPNTIDDLGGAQEIGLGDVINFFATYKVKILGSTLVVGFLAIITMRMPDIYTAKLKLIPLPIKLAQATLMSESFADALVQRFDLTKACQAKDPIEARNQVMLRNRVNPEKENILQIEVDDVDPKRAAAIANVYPEKLDKLISSLGVASAMIVAFFLASALMLLKDWVASIRKGHPAESAL